MKKYLTWIPTEDICKIHAAILFSFPILKYYMSLFRFENSIIFAVMTSKPFTAMRYKSTVPSKTMVYKYKTYKFFNVAYVLTFSIII